MINPSDEPFFASKTMVLICIGIAATVLLVLIGVLVLVLFHVNAFELVATGIGGITGQGGAGVYRNVRIDGQTRAANAAVNTGITPGQLQTPASPPVSYGPPPTS